MSLKRKVLSDFITVFSLNQLPLIRGVFLSVFLLHSVSWFILIKEMLNLLMAINCENVDY